jgi:predicted SAM-dependent methyltransferase
MKLHIGCGFQHYPDWINIDSSSDLKPKPDLIHDATKPFPYLNDSVDFIYNEHFIEHISVEEAVMFFKESRRLLKSGGVIRIATIDLDNLMRMHLPENSNWRKDAHLDVLGLSSIQTRAESFNIAMRRWGHQYVYNFEEISRRLKESGFTNISVHEFKKSTYPELCNIETRLESDLIVEAVK